MKTPLPAAQLIHVTASWEPAPIHCLACGAEVFAPGAEPVPCDHLLFLYMTELRFTYIAPRMEEDVERSTDEMIRPTDSEFLEICPAATVVLRFDHNEVFWDELSIVVGIEMPVEARDKND